MSQKTANHTNVLNVETLLETNMNSTVIKFFIEICQSIEDSLVIRECFKKKL